MRMCVCAHIHVYAHIMIYTHIYAHVMTWLSILYMKYTFTLLCVIHSFIRKMTFPLLYVAHTYMMCTCWNIILTGCVYVHTYHKDTRVCVCAHASLKHARVCVCVNTYYTHTCTCVCTHTHHAHTHTHTSNSFSDESVLWDEQSHATHMSESRQTYEQVMSHIRMSHVTHANEKYHAYEYASGDTWVMSHSWMSHVTRQNKRCHTYKCVMSHLYGLDLPRVKTRERWHLGMSNVPHMNESRHTEEYSVSQIQMRHGIPIWVRHATSMKMRYMISKNESCHT